MQTANLTLGKLGEQAAANYLISKGYKILKRNVRIGTGEIDILAQKVKTMYVIEVKTRRNVSMGKPYEAVTSSKAKRLIQMGEKFALQNNLKHSKLSLGVIAVQVDENDQVLSIKNYDYFI